MWFANDLNESLKFVQRAGRRDSTSAIAAASVDAYEKAWGLLKPNEPRMTFEHYEVGFDSRVLQFAHDYLAAQYRHIESSSPDSRQPRLGQTEEAYLSELKENWNSWLASKCEVLKWEREFSLNIIRIMENPLTDVSVVAKAALETFLAERYYNVEDPFKRNS